MEKPKGLHDPKEKLFIWKGGVMCCLHWLKSPVVPRPAQAAGVALRTGTAPRPPLWGAGSHRFPEMAQTYCFVQQQPPGQSSRET